MIGHPFFSSETKGPGEQGAAGYCPKILLIIRAQKTKWCSVLSRGVIGKSALEIGQFLRRNFWMISGGPLLSRPLCFTADFFRPAVSADYGRLKQLLVYLLFLQSRQKRWHAELFENQERVGPWSRIQNHKGKKVLPALLQKLVGEISLIFCREIWWEIWREICGIFSDPQNKGSHMSVKTSEHFSYENS